MKRIIVVIACHEKSTVIFLSRFNSRNERKVSDAYTTEETKKATIRLLRTIVILSQNLQSLPDEVMMTMKLLYYDDGILKYD